MAGAELHDIGALAEFRTALVRFRDRTRGIPDALRLRASRAKQDLAGRRHALEARIEELEYSAGEDEPDGREGGDAERRCQLDRLRRRLEQIEGAQAELGSATAEHALALGRWRSLMESTVPAAIAFLSRKHAQAIDALSVGLPGGVPVARGGSSPSADGSRALPWMPDSPHAQSDPVHAVSPDELPILPKGFVWAPISQLDRVELPDRHDFRKGVSYEDMIVGLQRLWSELIPLLQSAPEGGRDACATFDRANGRIDPRGFPHPSSLADLWGHFFDRRFSKEFVRLEIDRTGKWHVVNGRHRIFVALDLGWKFIPAEVVDASARTSGQ
ncbi:MAG TPA: hypothetical protein VK804_18410 [Bradyrhizobium sp.]|jgi:hypothetical protein|uniref:hypothetical protein n=1 Tax=Bradyrhizobium sp. TaxID=376 RepID=UPI002C2B1F35|nr:hypothetical protein [Bradyrhizobium sp.]HTB02443.1 hypothetical protein [Bradyrhizobium sp.]